jgi:hypothetical protein
VVASIASDCHIYIYPGKTLTDFLLFDLDFFDLALTWGRYTCLRAMIHYKHDTNEHSAISSLCHGIRGLIAENTMYNVPLSTNVPVRSHTFQPIMIYPEGSVCLPPTWHNRIIYSIETIVECRHSHVSNLTSHTNLFLLSKRTFSNYPSTNNMSHAWPLEPFAVIT